MRSKCEITGKMHVRRRCLAKCTLEARKARACGYKNAFAAYVASQGCGNKGLRELATAWAGLDAEQKHAYFGKFRGNRWKPKRAEQKTRRTPIPVIPESDLPLGIGGSKWPLKPEDLPSDLSAMWEAFAQKYGQVTETPNKFDAPVVKLCCQRFGVGRCQSEYSDEQLRLFLEHRRTVNMLSSGALSSASEDLCGQASSLFSPFWMFAYVTR